MPDHRFPSHLPHHNIPTIGGDELTALSPHFEGLSLKYIQQFQKQDAVDLRYGLRACSFEEITELHPTEATLLIENKRVHPSNLPNHVIEVTNQDGTTINFRPIHGMVLGTHCANLTSVLHCLPPKPVTRRDGSVAITLPVVTVSLPNHESFLTIYSYLHTKDPRELILAMLPIPEHKYTVAEWPKPSRIAEKPGFQFETITLRDALCRFPAPMLIPPDEDSGCGAAARWIMPEVQTYSNPVDHYHSDSAKNVLSATLAETFAYDLIEISKHAHYVQGFWANAVTLAINDKGFWDVFDLSWAVIIEALSIVAERQR